MKEIPLVVFTILTQMAVGASWSLALFEAWTAARPDGAASILRASGSWLAIILMMVLALVASVWHLGAPADAWRAACNWRTSWLSREIIAAGAFTGAVLLRLVYLSLDGFSPVVGGIAIFLPLFLGPALIYCMASAYRLRTVPAWNTKFTLSSFIVTSLLLGSLAAGILLAPGSGAPAVATTAALRWIALGTILLTTLNLVLSASWVAVLATGLGPAPLAATAIVREHRVAFALRLALSALGILSAGLMLFSASHAPGSPPLLLVTFGTVLASEILGRFLFYAGHIAHDVYMYAG